MLLQPYEGQILRGGHAGGRCFGYNIEHTANGVRQVINLKEAALVRRIFEMSADGASLNGIAKTFNTEKIPTSRPRAGKQFATWCPSAIRAILHNELYSGRVIWNRSHFVKQPGTNKRQKRPRPRSEWRIIDRPDLRIIDESLWTRVQDRLAEKKAFFGNDGGLSRRSTSSPYLLTGFLKCGQCGANLQIVGPQLYGCPQHFGRGTCDNRLKVRRDALERSLLAGLQKAVFDPEVLDYIIEGLRKQLVAAIDSARSGIAEQAARRRVIESEIARLAAAIAEHGHSKALLAALTDRERDLAALTAQIVEGPKSVDVQLAEIRDFVTTRLKNIQSLISRNEVSKAKLLSIA